MAFLKKRASQHMLFVIMFFVKCCLLYVFADIFIRLSFGTIIRESLNKVGDKSFPDNHKSVFVSLNGHFPTNQYWLTAGILLGVGIILDVFMTIMSLFLPRVSIGILCISCFLHVVIILPQHVTGIYMAKNLDAESQIGFEHDLIRLTRRVLFVFSAILITIETICSFIHLLFYVFLVWKPMPKVDELAIGNQHAASPSNTFRAGSNSNIHSNSIFITDAKKGNQSKATVTKTLNSKASKNVVVMK